VVRTPVLAGELSLSRARLMAGRVTTSWVRRPLSVNQLFQLSLLSLRGRWVTEVETFLLLAALAVVGPLRSACVQAVAVPDRPGGLVQ